MIRQRENDKVWGLRVSRFGAIFFRVFLAKQAKSARFRSVAHKRQQLYYPSSPLRHKPAALDSTDTFLSLSLCGSAVRTFALRTVTTYRASLSESGAVRSRRLGEEIHGLGRTRLRGVRAIDDGTSQNQQKIAATATYQTTFE